MAYRIGVIPGDGIGPEVVAEGLKVLDATGIATERTTFDIGAERYLDTGEVLPDDVFEGLKGLEAAMLGAVGDPRVPPGVLERGLLLKLRFDLDLYVNLRPVKLYPGVPTPLAGKGPNEIDMIVVRENTEGLYTGAGDVTGKDTPDELATQESINTRKGVERVIRYAFDRADARPRRKLTLVHKTNVLTNAGDLWMRTFEAVGAEHPDVERDYMHVDAACLYFVSQPERFDVVVTDNLFGDILTDLGAAIAGGMGLAASGNLNPDRTGPSLFEPVHGSAPDIAGKGWANPIACILSVALMLEDLGESEVAMKVEQAAVATLGRLANEGKGMAGEAMGYTTQQVGDMVVETLGK
ncbi:MAG: 3-isopropylmalate dehydrogenase [Actinomycetota bacterium]